eukprot:1193521-Prorocentrum_minimum.AAC.2
MSKQSDWSVRVTRVVKWLADCATCHRECAARQPGELAPGCAAAAAAAVAPECGRGGQPALRAGG